MSPDDSPDPAGKGALLLHLLRHERFEGCERSFKMSERSLLANRYLVGINGRDVVPARLLGLCTRIGMPEAHRVSLQEQIGRASTVHFGFEEGPASGTYKVYLEFAGSLRDAVASHPPGAPVLLHLAFKWDVLDGEKCAVASYLCHPGLGPEALLERLESVYAAGSGASREVATDIVRLAARRTRAPLMYLEVREQGNPRLSFDVNVHEADLCLRDIEEPVFRMSERCSIPETTFDRIYRPLRGRKLAHVSGGLDRGGRDFLTLYYPSESP